MIGALSSKDHRKLNGVHPDLVKVVSHAVRNIPHKIMVVEGLRDIERQRKLKAQGKSKTLRSRHLTGHAIDACALVDGKCEWNPPYSEDIANAMKASSEELGIPMRFGIDWGWDSPHFELCPKCYSANDTSWKDADPTLRIGASGEKVEEAQTRLKELGYQIGTVDGEFGDITRRAVAAFEVDNGLASDGIMDEEFFEALKDAKPIEMSETRQETTAKDLRQAGSTQAKVAFIGKRVSEVGGVAVVGVKVIEGLDGLMAKVDQVDASAAKATSLVDTVSGLVLNPNTYFTVAVLALASAAWYGFNLIEWDRVFKHRMGRDLSR